MQKWKLELREKAKLEAENKLIFSQLTEKKRRIKKRLGKKVQDVDNIYRTYLKENTTKKPKKKGTERVLY